MVSPNHPQVEPPPLTTTAVETATIGYPEIVVIEQDLVALRVNSDMWEMAVDRLNTCLYVGMTSAKDVRVNDLVVCRYCFGGDQCLLILRLLKFSNTMLRAIL